MKRRLQRIIALLTTSLCAYCGAKGSPQPPIRDEPPAATDGGIPQP